MIRDFTYIDDICESLIRLINKPALPSSSFDKQNPTPSSSWSPFKIFNIGNSSPTHLMEYIKNIESVLNKKAIINYLPMQPGDVKETFSDTTALEQWVGFRPNTSIANGVSKFISWYRDFYDL